MLYWLTLSTIWQADWQDAEGTASLTGALMYKSRWNVFELNVLVRSERNVYQLIMLIFMFCGIQEHTVCHIHILYFECKLLLNTLKVLQQIYKLWLFMNFLFEFKFIGCSVVRARVIPSLTMMMIMRCTELHRTELLR